MKKLLFLHGALGSSAHWQKTIELLNPHFNCRALDFPGHGDALPADALTLSDLKVFLEEELRKDKEIEGIVAYSMGGYVAIRTLLDSAFENIELMALAVKLNWNPQIAEQECANLNEEKLMPILDKLKALHKDNYSNLLSNTASVLRSIAEKPISAEEFSKLGNKLSFVLGENDKMVSREETATFVNANPNTRFDLLPEQGHLLEKMNPELLAATIIQKFSQNVQERN